MLEFDQRVQKIMGCALKIYFFLVRFLWEIHFLFPSPSKKCIKTISVIISPIYLQNYAFQSRLTFACCKMALFNYSKVFLSFPHLLCLSHETHLKQFFFQHFCKLNPRQSSMSPRGYHLGIWKVWMHLARIFIPRAFQGHNDARMPYFRGHRGALSIGAHI